VMVVGIPVFTSSGLNDSQVDRELGHFRVMDPSTMT